MRKNQIRRRRRKRKLFSPSSFKRNAVTDTELSVLLELHKFVIFNLGVKFRF